MLLPLLLGLVPFLDGDAPAIALVWAWPLGAAFSQGNGSGGVAFLGRRSGGIVLLIRLSPGPPYAEDRLWPTST